MDMECFSDVVP